MTDVSSFIRAKDDWPTSLLLEEVWLRIRRVLVHNLEKEGIWVGTQEYKRFIRSQKKIGERIKTNLLKKILGDSDYAYLNSNLVFGNNNKRIRTRLPYMAAFGYSMGSVMSILVGQNGKNYTTEISNISSVFNVAIAIFDHMLDKEPKLFRKFTKIFNDKILLRVANAKSDEWLQNNFEKVTSSEIRLLLRMTFWCLTKLFSHYSQHRRQDVWRDLISCMLLAYNAETKSSNFHSRNDAVVISRRTKQLPFLILFHTARLVSYTYSNGENDYTTLDISRNIGEVFWYTDDLIDVLKDLEDNCLNSIVSNIIEENETLESSQKYSVLTELLNGQYIENISNQICSRIQYILSFLRSNNFEQNEIRLIRNVIVCYVRNWME